MEAKRTNKTYQVEICTGTACYVLGAAELLELEDLLIREQRRDIAIKAMNCQSFCREEQGRPPYVRVNGEVHSDMTLDRLMELIDMRGVQYE